MGVSTQIKIGASAGAMVTLASLGISAPLASFDAGEQVQTSDGNFITRGYSSIILDWASITQEEIEKLRAYRGATVYIYAPIDVSRAYRTFSSIMVWPKREDGIKFQLKYTHLVAA